MGKRSSHLDMTQDPNCKERKHREELERTENGRGGRTAAAAMTVDS